MFHRNPYMPETSDVPHEVDSDHTSMFAKIIGAIKEADKVVENKTTSVDKVILFNRKLYNRKRIIYKVIFINTAAYIHTQIQIYTSMHMYDRPLNQIPFLSSFSYLD